ncbi:MAG: DNA replication/repair protein RecF, partial [Actinomycetota bacterium]
GELAARRFASHGETWAAVLCLRLGFAGAVQEETGEPPLLLLDDPFSGLDPVRRQRVRARLEGRGQVLVAVPDETQVPEGAAVFEVAEGSVRAH